MRLAAIEISLALKKERVRSRNGQRMMELQQKRLNAFRTEDEKLYFRAAGQIERQTAKQKLKLSQVKRITDLKE
ncbi:MAG: hypothetical protein R2681_07985 [Pyrinomonadaceae bacterium]